MNALEDIFARQRHLAANFIPIEKLFSGDLNELERQKYLISYCALLTEETIELLRELPARKFWRPSIQNKPVDWAKFKDELSDIMHIVAALALIAGIDAQEFHELYVIKNEVNLSRVENKS